MMATSKIAPGTLHIEVSLLGIHVLDDPEPKMFCLHDMLTRVHNTLDPLEESTQWRTKCILH